MRTHSAVPALSILSVFALAACGSSQPGNASAEAAKTQPTAVSAPAGQADHYHAELALASPPAVTANGKDVVVMVNVTNDGPAAFGTQATPVHNVNLGAHSIDATGKIVDNDLARGSMPEVAPGKTVKATILLPVDKVLGHGAEILPVEEGVAWFSQWGTKPLIVGPFKACSDGSGGKICNASGEPLPIAPRQP